MRGLCLLLFLILMIAATTPLGTPIAIEIENASQYEITELRLHLDPAYGDAANLLDAPLAVGETIQLESEQPPFITVFREKYAHGPILAFTTGRTIDLESTPGYRVEIFDESFRVEGIGTWEPQAGCSCASITGGM